MVKAPVLETIVVTKSQDDIQDISYLKQDYFNDNPKYPLCTQEENEKYKAQNAERLRAYYNDQWTMICISATGYAELISNNQTFTTELGDSISGVESDYEQGIKDYQNEFIYNILVECRQKKIKIAPNLKLIVKEKF
jgi:hypothetical protein